MASNMTFNANLVPKTDATLELGSSSKKWKINGGGTSSQFLRGDGTWATPAGTYNLPVATSNTLGGVQLGYTSSNKNYAVQSDNDGNIYVNVPWTDNDTWQANSISAAGYVAATGGVANKVWKTDADGNPDWLDDANTTYTSKAAVSGGTEVSLVTTGEKYTWNSKTSNTGTVTSITLTAGSGISLSATGAITTSGSRTISHSDTSSQSSVTNTDRTYIQSITLDDFGHVTALTSGTETVTNSDQKVKQEAVTASSYTNWRSLPWGKSNSATEGFTPQTQTDQLYTTDVFSVQPSTGTLKATTFKGNLTGNVTGNVTGNITGNVTGTSTNADNVSVTNTIPASGTEYYPIFADSNTTGYKILRANNDFSFYDGPTGSSFWVGNSSNITGAVNIFATNGYYGRIICDYNQTANRFVRIPDADGVIALTTSDITGNAATATVADRVENNLVVGGQGGKAYNGSNEVTIFASDLGVSSALTFAGIIYETLPNRDDVGYPSLQNPVHLYIDSGNHQGSPIGDGTSGSINQGTVVICHDTQDEFLWSADALGNEGWFSLGLASSFALHNHIHGNISNEGAIGATADLAVVTTTNGVLTTSNMSTSDPSTSGASANNQFISAVSQDSKGKITITKHTLNTSGSWAGTAATALNASNDSDGNLIKNTYLKLSGGTMTGNLVLNKITGTSGINFGSSFPSSPTVGQIFFKQNTDGYVKKTGDTLGTTAQLSRVGISKSWWGGRDAAIIRQTSYTGYNAIISAKTTNGSWELGPYSNNYLHFAYVPDTSYNGSTNTGTISTIKMGPTGTVHAAVWNDYAEYRKDNKQEKDIQIPGKCVKELGDGTLALTTKRLERGCEIISDTFGFAIGQDEENGYNTPIASNGRVLAYPYESIEDFALHIGWAVCSGPDGTVSIMTEEEEEKYPSRIIGTISEIPDYEEWGTGKVKVNGRVWIRIK